MDDRRKLEILRVKLEAILSETKEPFIKVYAQSGLDETKDLPKEQIKNAHCEKHNWYGGTVTILHEKCPECDGGITQKRLLADSLKPLVDALEQYQKLLSDELDEVIGMASIHGWKSNRHEQGKEMRKKIADIKAVLNFR